jgi:RNA-splicing ligase RtcB
MSRNEAKRRFTVADHAAATAGVECRKDADVLDETPGAYKPIDAVMEAQRDLVETSTRCARSSASRGERPYRITLRWPSCSSRT